MAQVTLRINGYSYLVGCEDGQERHLEAMGEAVQSRIDSIKTLGQTGEARLLVLAALLLADELHDKQAGLRRSAGRADRRRTAPPTDRSRLLRHRAPPCAIKRKRLRKRWNEPRYAVRGCPVRQATHPQGR